MFQKGIIPLCIVCLSSCSMSGVESTTRDSTHTGVEISSGRISDEQKIRLALARKKEMGSIRKGDYMALNNNPETAISYYQEVLEKLPTDIVVKKKLAHVYYQSRNWSQSYEMYGKVPFAELNSDEEQELIRSLFYDPTRIDRIGELARYGLNTEKKSYYTTIDACYSNIHNCIVSIESYTGSNQQVRDLQDVIKKATTVSPDYQYRNFLVAALLYKQGMYRAVDVMTREILDKRPNYTEVIKLRGFALYELGRGTEAGDVLLGYLEQKPKDLESIVRLGEIYYTLGDYSTSNLYLNNAVTNGYTKKTEIERRLAYNYSAMQDDAGAIKVLSYLLQEDDVNEDDFAVAISLALKMGDNTRAYSWAYSGIQKYQNSKILLPLYLQTLRLNGRYDDVISQVQGLSDDDKKNPLIQLEYAIVLYERGDINTAETIFDSIHELDPHSDWGIESGNYLGLIQAQKSNMNSGSLFPF